MDGPAIITQVINPKEDEGRVPGAGEKGKKRPRTLRGESGEQAVRGVARGGLGRGPWGCELVFALTPQRSCERCVPGRL